MVGCQYYGMLQDLSMMMHEVQHRCLLSKQAGASGAFRAAVSPPVGGNCEKVTDKRLF